MRAPGEGREIDIQVGEMGFILTISRKKDPEGDAIPEEAGA